MLAAAADPDTPIVGWEEEFAAIREYAAGVPFTDRQSQLTWRGRNHTSRDDLRCAAMMPRFRDAALGIPASTAARDAVCVGCLSGVPAKSGGHYRAGLTSRAEACLTIMLGVTHPRTTSGRRRCAMVCLDLVVQMSCRCAQQSRALHLGAGTLPQLPGKS